MQFTWCEFCIDEERQDFGVGITLGANGGLQLTGQLIAPTQQEFWMSHSISKLLGAVVFCGALTTSSYLHAQQQKEIDKCFDAKLQWMKPRLGQKIVAYLTGGRSGVNELIQNGHRTPRLAQKLGHLMAGGDLQQLDSAYETTYKRLKLYQNNQWIIRTGADSGNNIDRWAPWKLRMWGRKSVRNEIRTRAAGKEWKPDPYYGF